MSYVLTDSKAERDPSALPIPGPTLVLERGKRVAVNIVNASTSHAAVHWHGIELESFPDGVPGVSGAGTQLLPPIAPRESLTVAFTPPRAGSFMYHSHFSESQQVGSGLYGPIVVLDSGEHFDPETDRILFFGTAGGLRSFLDPAPTVLLNGNARPAPMQLTAGTRYRFRLFNLAGDVPTFVTLTQGDAPVSWRAVAKDGYTLPPSQAIEKPAALVFDPGEIYDFEFTPARAGTLSLRFGLPRPHPPAQGPPLVTVDVHVR